jgi:O-methyltransferase
MLNLIQNLFKIFEIKVSRIVEEVFPAELSEKTTKILKEVEPFTMTSQARLTSLAISVNYINESGIAGDIVECGVWAGGSITAAIKIDKQFKSARKYWLYDTFEGMTVPSIQDPEKAHRGYQERKTVTGGSAWCNVDQTTVKTNLENLGVDLTDCIFVAGDVADTLSSIKPKSIALLRLDTDWYESTKIELQ